MLSILMRSCTNPALTHGRLLKNIFVPISVLFFWCASMNTQMQVGSYYPTAAKTHISAARHTCTAFSLCCCLFWLTPSGTTEHEDFRKHKAAPFRVKLQVFTSGRNKKPQTKQGLLDRIFSGNRSRDKKGTFEPETGEDFLNPQQPQENGKATKQR